jgi:uncharacterized membrane protein
MNIGKPWIVGFLLLLVLSLAGNLFIGGVVLGRQFSQTQGPAVSQVVRAFFDTFPEEARPVVRRHLRANTVDIILHVRRILAARGHVADVLSSPEVDEAALANAFLEIRESTASLQELIHRILIEAIGELPPEVRAQWKSRWRGGGLSIFQ